MESVLDLPRDRALNALAEQANRQGPDSPVRPTQGFPPACIPTCLYLLLTTDNLEEALIDVINLGGDADSAGAILGAFVGVIYWSEPFPTAGSSTCTTTRRSRPPGAGDRSQVLAWLEDPGPGRPRA